MPVLLTLQQIFNSTRQLRDHVNPTNSFELTRAAGLPYLSIFAIQAQYQPLTQEDAAYHEVTLLFHDMRFNATRTEDYNFEVDVVPSFRMYTHKPSFATQRVQVRCTCADYYFTWWLSLNHYNSLAGPEMPLYKRLTPPPPVGLPLRNPNSVPGACKHITRFSRYLVEKNFVTYP